MRHHQKRAEALAQNKRIKSGPCVVNKFDTEADAVAAAVAWSKREGASGERDPWTVIHGPSETGLTFYVERGIGGIIRNTERLVGTYENGKADA